MLETKSLNVALSRELSIKALIIPILLVLFVHVLYRKNTKKEIESKCFKFIWDGKPEKVKRNT